MTPVQCRAGRALLDWSRPRLAEAAGVSSKTIDRYEGGESVDDATVEKLAGALREAGVVIGKMTVGLKG